MNKIKELLDKRKTIGILVAIMTVALLGIILVQVKWMNHAMQLKQETLNRAINEALYSATIKYDNENKLRYFFSPSVTVNYDTVMVAGGQQVIISGSQQSSRTQFGFSSGNIRSSVTVVPPPPQKNLEFNNEEMVVNEDSSRIEIKRVYKDGHFQMQVDLQQEMKDQLQELEEIHTLIAKEKQREMQVFVEQWHQEFNFGDVMQRVNPEMLKRILTEELKHRNIQQPFEFGIQYNDSVVYATSPVVKGKLLKSEHRTRLFPKDIFQRPNDLVVVFTNSRQLMLQNYGNLLWLSGLFTFLILLIFSYSVYQILHQKKLSEMKSDFINNMTHEFKTPLATISLAADSIGNPKVIGDAKKVSYFTSMIKQENKRMNNQVERILQVARIERKDVHLKKELADIHAVIADSLDSFTLNAQESKAELIFEPEAEHSFIEMDTEHVYHMLKNLVDNALKYNNEVPRVVVKTWNVTNGIVFLVADNGIGMSKKVLSQVFEKFYREQHGNVHNVKGHGLGLSYVKSIVEFHKGTIKVESKPGKGSVFTVFLPFKS